MLFKNIEFQIKQVLKEHPGLSFDEQSKMFSGTLVVDEDDFYVVTIDLGSFPRNFPVVREIDERIRPIADNHMYSDNRCCFTVPAKEQILLRKGFINSALQFINKIVIPFFQNNSFREINGYYKEGEYSHGSLGAIEAYSDILGINNIELTIKILIRYLKGDGYGKNDPCFCGNNKRFKDCHLYKFNDLKLIDREMILYDLKTYLNL
jgi:hypothetical protein